MVSARLPYRESSVAREQLAYALEDLTFPLISAGRLEEAMTGTTEAMQLWQELGTCRCCGSKVIPARCTAGSCRKIR